MTDDGTCPDCGTPAIADHRVVVQPDPRWRCELCAHEAIMARLTAGETVTSTYHDGSVTAFIENRRMVIIDHGDPPPSR